MTTLNQIEKEIAILEAKFDALQKQEWTKENFEQLSIQEDLIGEAISAMYRIKNSIVESYDYDPELIVRANY